MSTTDALIHSGVAVAAVGIVTAICAAAGEPNAALVGTAFAAPIFPAWETGQAIYKAARHDGTPWTWPRHLLDAWEEAAFPAVAAVVLGAILRGGFAL